MFTVRLTFRKLSKRAKQWLINVSEELVMRNAILDNGRSLKQTFIKKS